MRVLLVNQFFWPDAAATAQQLGDLAEGLARAGHQVHVLCSRGAYRHDSAEAGRPAGLEPVRVTRLPALGLGSQLAGYACFHLLSLPWLLLFGWRYRLVVSLSTPPLVGLVPALLARLRGAGQAHVTWLMDMHPDIEVALGRWNGRRPWVRLLARLARASYALSDQVVTLTPGMAQRVVDGGTAPERVSVISVWSDLEPPAGGADPELEQELGLRDELVVMHSGNAGVAHGLEDLCHAMVVLADDPRVHFLFVGGGTALGPVEDLVRRRALTNVSLRGYQPRERLAQSLALGDVHVVAQRPCLEGMLMPSKLMGVLAVGRPVLALADPAGELGSLVSEQGLGRVFAPGQGDELVAWLQELADDRSRLAPASQRAQAYFQGSYTQQAGVRAWLRLVDDLETPRPAAPAMAGDGVGRRSKRAA